MAILSQGKALRNLPKSPVILRAILQGVTQEQAVNSWDGDWNVVYVVCHLRDLEVAYIERVRMMLAEDNPTFPRVDQTALVIENKYAEADLQTVLGEYEANRRAFIELVSGLSDTQWERGGQHPHFGETTILTQAINNTLHDMDHIEQVVRALGDL